jgi:tetratricopeptide (TPR) repeat protein
MSTLGSTWSRVSLSTVGVTVASLLAWLHPAVVQADEARSAEDWYREGVEQLGAGKLDSAVQSFQFCVQVKSDLKECWFNLGVALGRKRDIAGEARAYEKAVALDPRYARAHFNLAVAYDDLGRAQEALKHYDLAILYEPTAVDAVQNRALLLVTLERFDQAIEGFEKAAKLQPDNAEVWYNLAQAAQLKGMRQAEPLRAQQLQRAVTHYQQCLERDPKHHRAMYNLGVVQHRLGNGEQEVAWYRKALELKPNYTPALYNLGFALRDKADKGDAGARAAAKAAFEQFLKVAGQVPSEQRFVEAVKRELQKR